MKVPILSGMFSDENSDFRVSYPRNLIPVPQEQGISTGYLRPADGIIPFAVGPGIDRGGINWQDVCYRIMGTKLVSINALGVVSELGTIPGTDQVTFDYSFDELAISGDNKLFFWDGSTLTQNTDVDLGDVIDFIWVDGYFMTTDGEFLVVTELGDPLSVSPLKYGSSEIDPDPVKALIKLRGEPYALNRYTIEVFDNVGGATFPFQRIDGAQIQRGTIGTHSCCLFIDAIAFLGGGRNEAPAIWLGSNGISQKLSTREIEQILLEYDESVLENVLMEAHTVRGHRSIYVHLPNKTLVYDSTASKAVEKPIWYILTTGLEETGQYRAKNMIWCYNKWLVGDTLNPSVGYFDNNVSSHWGSLNSWQLSTMIIYNKSQGAVFHELELIALTGRAVLGDNSTILTDYSLDGVTWSQQKGIEAGTIGDRSKRLVWLQQGRMDNYRIQRFKGTSDAHISFALLDVRIEGLNF